ncbi:3'-5' exonuclease [Cryptotrichosporon argae]
MASKAAPSSNWAQLKKSLPVDPSSNRQQRRRTRLGGLSSFKSKVDAPEPPAAPEAGPSRTVTVDGPAPTAEEVVFLPAPDDSSLLHELRQMVAGRNVLNESKKAPGNYVAIDCEMVGLGHLGAESALARVSLVNYHGHVLLDTFVQPRERVTDYRTWISGVREADILRAPAFDTVQKQVAALVEGRVLVGHALENDTKALLLSHPQPLVRDTQKSKALREKAKNKRPGLKKLVEMELGLKIQGGQHSSVTDARATMALYRLHKVEWENSIRHITEAYRAKTGQGEADKGKGKKGGKRKREDEDEGEDGGEEGGQAAEAGDRGKKQYPGGGRKGISSGLGVIVRRNGKRVEGDEPRRRGEDRTASAGKAVGNWWEQLPS